MKRSMFMENTVGWMNRYCGGSNRERDSSHYHHNHHHHHNHHSPTITHTSTSLNSSSSLSSPLSSNSNGSTITSPLSSSSSQILDISSVLSSSSSSSSLLSSPIESSLDHDDHHHSTSFVADSFICDNLVFTWHCLFEQPGISPDFYTRLNLSKVLLESIYSSNMRLNGIVRVLNLAFVKRVFIRYTINNWQSYSDLDCQHLSWTQFEQV